MADAARPSSGPTGSTSSVPPQHPSGHPPGNPAGELRLAVVMNGGVSLAIWMGGVAHELDLLRRASARDERPSGATGPIGRDSVPDYDRPVFDAWRSAAGRQGVGAVVIDVIAGTSAGGLNGALLATAAARGSSLDPPDADHADGPYLRQVWEKEAALEQGHLLRGGERNGTLPTSVLDGEYFEQMIESVLGRIRAPVGPRQPVTLFLTATAVGSAEQRYADAYDRPFLVADHRRLYRFRQDPRRYVYSPVEHISTRRALSEFDDFAAELTKAARASASFPGAFAAVRELESMARPPVRVLPRRAGPAAWLIDGGVLDNAPFAPVLDSIARRPVSGPVRRVLMYVVPTRGTPPAPTVDGSVSSAGTAGPASSTNPGAADGSGGTAAGASATGGANGGGGAALGPSDAPAVLQLAAAGFTFPREVDFRDDVDQLDTMLRSGDASEPENLALLGGMLSDPRLRTGLMASADGLLDSYRRGRAAGVVAQLRTAAAPVGGADGVRRLARVEDLPPEAVLLAGPAWVDPDLRSLPDLTADPWRWGTGPAERCVRLLVRHLRGVVGGSHARDPELLHGIGDLSDRLSEIEAVRDALHDAMAAAPARSESSASISVEDMNALLVALDVPRVVGGLVTAAARSFAAVATPGLSVDDVVRCAFTVEVLSRALHAREPYDRAAPFEFLRVGPDVEMPVIGLDTARGLAVGDTKLYGLRAGHFAAFGKREWRRWDWVCGRLDAVTHLGRMLGMDSDGVAEVQRAVLASEGMAADDLERRLDELAATTNLELLRELHAEPAGRLVMERFADEVFGVAAGIRDPRFLGRVGRTVAVLSRTSPLPGMGALERMGRVLLGRRVRRRIWGWTRD
jgi:predicted acylesterase/phospholipase RssA